MKAVAIIKRVRPITTVKLTNATGETIGRVVLREGRAVIEGDSAKRLLDGLYVRGPGGRPARPEDGEDYLRGVVLEFIHASCIGVQAR
jgi:hypothetical protein